MVSLPLWAIFAVSFGSPALAFLGVLLAQWTGRQGARELELRSRREETMRTLRWAAELAVSGDEGRSDLGVCQLVALAESRLLDEAQLLFVSAALLSVLDDAVEEVESASDAVEVVRSSASSDPEDSDG